MHDINNLDQRGIPGIMIASTEFVDARNTQSAALGFETPSVFVQHPIQDRTDAEMHTLATQVADEVMSKLFAG